MLIISNGRYSNWDISAKYAVWYSHEKFICTNHDGCELFDTIGGNCALLKRRLDNSSFEDGTRCGIGAGKFIDI